MFTFDFRNRTFILTITLLLFLKFPGTGCLARDRIVNIGVGISFFVPPLNFNSDYSRSQMTYSNNFFIEKPALFNIAGDSNLVFTPGVSYFRFNQTQGPGTALGGGNELDLIYSSYGIYGRILYKKYYEPEKVFNWYFGVTTGIHIYTRMRGENSWWMLQSEGYVSGKDEYNTNARSFFNLFYMGLTAGFTAKTNIDSFLKPAFEITLLPNFINFTDTPVKFRTDTYSKTIATFSVVLGF